MASNSFVYVAFGLSLLELLLLLTDMVMVSKEKTTSMRLKFLEVDVQEIERDILQNVNNYEADATAILGELHAEYWRTGMLNEFSSAFETAKNRFISPAVGHVFGRINQSFAPAARTYSYDSHRRGVPVVDLYPLNISEVQIMIPIMSESQKELKETVGQSWTRSFPSLDLVVFHNNPDSPQIIETYRESEHYYSIQVKPFIGAESIYKPLSYKVIQYFYWVAEHRPERKWFFKADTDTLVFPNNLVSLLANYNPDDIILLCSARWPHCSGGAGYALSKGAIKYLSSGLKLLVELPYDQPDVIEYEDRMMYQLMQSYVVNVPFYWSLPSEYAREKDPRRASYPVTTFHGVKNLVLLRELSSVLKLVSCGESH